MQQQDVLTDITTLRMFSYKNIFVIDMHAYYVVYYA